MKVRNELILAALGWGSSGNNQPCGVSHHLEYRGPLLNDDNVRLLSAVDWEGERETNGNRGMRTYVLAG